MGADGGIEIVSRSDWDEQAFGIEPKEIGLRAETMVGVEVVFGYTGTNTSTGGGDYADREQMGEGWDEYYSRYETDYVLTAEQETKLKALRWFEKNREYFELWT